MENVILNVDLITMQFRKFNIFVLPCKVSEGGCASTSLDVGAYTWNQHENCLFKEIRSVYNGQMMKFVTSFQQIQNPSWNLNVFFANFNDQQKICGHPLQINPTNYDEFYHPLVWRFRHEYWSTKESA